MIPCCCFSVSIHTTNNLFGENEDLWNIFDKIMSTDEAVFDLMLNPKVIKVSTWVLLDKMLASTQALKPHQVIFSIRAILA